MLCQWFCRFLFYKYFLGCHRARHHRPMSRVTAKHTTLLHICWLAQLSFYRLDGGMSCMHAHSQGEGGELFKIIKFIQLTVSDLHWVRIDRLSWLYNKGLNKRAARATPICRRCLAIWNGFREDDEGFHNGKIEQLKVKHQKCSNWIFNVNSKRRRRQIFLRCSAKFERLFIAAIRSSQFFYDNFSKLQYINVAQALRVQLQFVNPLCFLISKTTTAQHNKSVQ